MSWAATGQPASCGSTATASSSTAPTRRLAGTGPGGQSASHAAPGSPMGCSSRSPRWRGTDTSSSSLDSAATHRALRHAPYCGRTRAEPPTPGRDLLRAECIASRIDRRPSAADEHDRLTDVIHRAPLVSSDISALGMLLDDRRSAASEDSREALLVQDAHGVGHRRTDDRRHSRDHERAPGPDS